MISREEQEQQQEKERVILSWSSTRKTTTYAVDELDALKKSSGGQGWLYFNPVTNAYEKPRSISLIPKRKRRLGV
jgi:hypothetical protein